MDSRTQDFLALLAYAYLRNGKAAKAVAVLEGLLVLRPGDAWARRSLAFAYLQSADYNRALALAVPSDPAAAPDPQLDLVRSRALFGLGRRKEAAELARRAAEGLRGNDGRRKT